MPRRLVLALPAVGFAAAILWLSTRPGGDLPAVGEGVPGMDKLLHLVEYLLFGLLLSLPLAETGGRRSFFVMLPGTAFAVVDEAVQTLVPGRMGDAADVAMDVVGLMLAVLLLLAWDRRRARRESTTMR